METRRKLALVLAWLACAACAGEDEGERNDRPDVQSVISPGTSNTEFFKSLKPTFSCPPPQKPGTLSAHLHSLFCLDPKRAIDCGLMLNAVVNADNQQTAKLFFSKTYEPAEALALWRDRLGKETAYRKDSARAREVCAGDDDNDLVANVRDACPGTRPLRPTDERGCETTKLPSAPPRAAIDTMLDGMGIMYDPRCNGAPIPALPSFSPGLFDYAYSHDANNPPTTMIALVAPDNQPANCELEYQFRATVVWPDGSEHFSTTTFSSRLAQVPVGARKFVRISKQPPKVRFWFADDLAPNEEAFSPPSAPRKVSFQVRVMNGAGLDSGWGQVHVVEGW